jgi:hypothetical protein
LPSRGRRAFRAPASTPARFWIFHGVVPASSPPSSPIPGHILRVDQIPASRSDRKCRREETELKRRRLRP